MGMRTFVLPETVSGSADDAALGAELIAAWEADGIFQIAATDDQDRITQDALNASRRFFARPFAEKSSYISDLSYTGYIASGEEVTDGEADYSEIYTVTPDIPLTDPRVVDGVPCHGPAPWPSDDYQVAMRAYMEMVGAAGETLLQLVALGLGVDVDTLTRLTDDGWHHMRVLRFPSRSETTERGIGAHTDYGLLVIAAQDDVGGLFVRPPVEGEKRNRNWLPGESMAGMYQEQEPWNFVTPVERVFTVFPGDILQFLTGGKLLSTPHKVRLALRERFTLAYFHEPSFDVAVRPLPQYDAAGFEAGDHIHYGSHFTSMFTRCYPERVTTKRIEREGRLDTLERVYKESLAEAGLA